MWYSTYSTKRNRAYFLIQAISEIFTHYGLYSLRECIADNGQLSDYACVIDVTLLYIGKIIDFATKIKHIKTSKHKLNISWDAFHPWWRHQMETFCALLALCAGNSPVTGEFPSQRPLKRSLDVFIDPRPNKRLSKQPETGDLRHHRTHYDVKMITSWSFIELFDVRKWWVCAAYWYKINHDFS